MKVKISQSRQTLCNSMDYTVHGILQARILKWVSFPFSPGNIPNPGIESGSPPLQVDSLPAEPPGKPNIMTKTNQINSNFSIMAKYIDKICAH